MADTTTKTLALKLTADTKGIDVVKTKLQEQEKSIKDISNLQVQVNALDEARAQLLLQMAKQQEAISTSMASLKLKETFQASVVKEFETELVKIDTLLQSIKTHTAPVGENLRTLKTGILSNKEIQAKEDAQAKSAAQRNKDEFDLANKTRNITLNSLRQTIEERYKLLDAANKQTLGLAIGNITGAESADRKKLLQELKTDMTERAKLRQNEYDLVEKALNQTKALEEKRASELAAIAAKQAKAKLESQAEYAKQLLKNEEETATKARKIELDALRQTITERNSILAAASKQRLATSISSILAPESSDRKKLLTNLRQDMTERAKLQQEEFDLVERALQKTRTKEAARAKIEEDAARQRLERQAATNRQLLANETDFNDRQRQIQLRGMRSSATAAFSTMPVTGVPARVPEDVIRSHDSLFARIGAINLEYRLWNEIINTVTNSLRAIPKIGIELEATKAVLTSTTGSSAGMAVTLEALTKEADRAGISLEAVRQSFRNFQASTSLAGVSAETTWKIFTNMNTVISGLHLSTDQANHVFLALAQMFNKSKVQSEELVKQLGNLLPGAFASFAKSMGISTQKLSEEMKKGVVYANETMENFSTFMATRFAAAFEAAATGLNANLNRMDTGFIKLGEAIYGVSGGPLNAIVIKIREFTDYLTASVKGENNFLQVTSEIANVLATVLTTSLIKAGVAVFDLEKALLAIKAAAVSAQAAMIALKDSALLLGSNAVLAGFTYLIIKMREVGMEQENIHARMRQTITLFNQQKIARDAAAAPRAKAEADPQIVSMDKEIQAYRERLKELESQRDKNIDFVQTDKGLQPILQTIKEAKKATQDLVSTREDLVNQLTFTIKKTQEDTEREAITGGDTVAKARERMHEKDLRDQKKYGELYVAEFKRMNEEADLEAQKALEHNAASLKKLRTQTTDPEATAAKIKEIEESNKKLQETRALYAKGLIEEQARGDEQAAKEAASANKKVAAEKLRGIKEEIKVDDQFLQTAANNAQNEIKLLDEKNKAKIYSFEKYAQLKKDILTKDFNTEKEWLDKQIALAQSSGRKDLIATFTEKKKRLQADYTAQVGDKGIIDTETSKNIEDYNTNLANIHSKYLDILGVENDSNEQTKIKNAELRKQIVAETTVAGIVGETAKSRLKEFDAVENNLKVQAKFKDYQENIRVAQDKYGESVARINVLKNVGAINDFTAAQKMKAANLEAIADKEKEISLMEDRLKLEQESGSPVAKSTQEAIRKARAELENFKLEADTVGQFFENSLGGAFENSFQALITNTKTAKEAFRDFAISIVQDIAKIVAQEARSAILKPILGMAFNALGGMFGSIAGSISSSIGTTAATEAPALLVAAKGGVFSGAGISAHSGTIVDKPTIFPFAKGGGLMGEAGPEAVLPLKRNSQGKLGVSLENSGQRGGDNIYYINTTVNAGSNSTPDAIASKASEAIMRAIAKQEINSAARPGNRLNKITKYG